MEKRLTKEQAKKEIIKLVELFRYNLPQYEQEGYKEESVRNEFIDKLFFFFGWDINNSEGLPEQYKEVIRQETMKIEGRNKVPDYTFRLYSQRKFLVEAKKPFIDISKDSSSSFQLRNYGWNSEDIPLSILTNFKQFVIYDCRIKPNQRDSPSVAVLFNWTFEDYLKEFDKIWNILSFEEVRKGSFDKFVEESKDKKGTTEVNQEFLKDIEYFREILAKNIAIRNLDLDVPALNYVVQVTLDRILFLRICEDRDIESYEKLKKEIEKGDSYRRLLDYTKYANEKYNSGIFDLNKDTITSKIKVDDDILKKIVSKLYFPNSQYQFDVIPIEILGRVYEQFLGEIIRLTPSHQAKVEIKEEVKKAGGIFYTPKYIVDYIVKNTVGKLIWGKTPKEIEKIKILDPACGSGSFLIGAYTCLLDYHLDYYSKTPKKYKKEIFQYSDKVYYLSTETKKKVLMNNIFGVDLDPQAVEVTKLSLLLKVLEHETKETINQQQKLFQERVLPNLDNNIKCGNSLVGSEFYRNKQITLSNETINKRVNIFDWNDSKNGFLDIMKSGRFDIIIGNPPYIQIQKLTEFYPEETKFIQEFYNTAKDKNIDIYIPFIEKGLSLLKEKGFLGYICPNRFFNSDYGKNLREHIKKYNLYHLVNFRHYLVFKNADTYTCLLFIQNNKQADYLDYKEIRNLYKTNDSSMGFLLNSKHDHGNLIIDKIKPHFLEKGKWYFMTEEERKIFDRIIKTQKFSECYEQNFQGLITGIDDIYILRLIKNKGKTKICYSKKLNKEVELESELLFNIIGDDNIKQFTIEDSDSFIIFPYKNNKLIEQKGLEINFPLIWEYLNIFKNNLKSREKNKFNNEKWYQYSRNQALDKQELKKILIPHVIKNMRVAFDSKGKYFIKNVGVNGITLKDSIQEDVLYFLAILNSPISSFFISKTSIFLSGGFYASNKQFAGEIPIKRINFLDKAEKDKHDKLVNLISAIIKSKNRINNIKNPNEYNLIERQIDSLQKEINNIIYELYGITKEEQEIIEMSKN